MHVRVPRIVHVVMRWFFVVVSDASGLHVSPVATYSKSFRCLSVSSTHPRVATRLGTAVFDFLDVNEMINVRLPRYFE
jgi:hypothetical protein